MPGEGNEVSGTGLLILLVFFAACVPIVCPYRVPCPSLWNGASMEKALHVRPSR